ncbi:MULTISPECIES: zeta toxin family protein [Chitinophagaceae]
MIQARLRIFGGPNGSGKSTLFDSLSKKYDTGIFLNADNIEKELATNSYIDLNDYGLTLTQLDLDNFLTQPRSQSLIQKSIDNNHPIHVSIKENIVVDTSKDIHSYEGALISAFIRFHLQEQQLDFCFETVMSHPSKIEEVQEAKLKGYKTYLYFICTDNPGINISRVENRVEKGGHNVAPEKISSRYYNTLNNLIAMIETVDKTYLFDNSGESLRWLARVQNNDISLLAEPETLPNWLINYVLKYFI